MAEPAADDRTAALDAALAKADKVLNGDVEAPADRLATMAAAITGETLAKAATDLPFVLPTPEAVALIGADLQKSIAAVALIDADRPLAKGMYSITTSPARSIASRGSRRTSAARSAGKATPDSKLPQQAVDIVNALKAFLIALIEEEVAEMLERTKNDVADVIEVVIVDEPTSL
jgi:hypothetical protein